MLFSLLVWLLLLTGLKLLFIILFIYYMIASYENLTSFCKFWKTFDLQVKTSNWSLLYHQCKKLEQN